MDEDDLVLLHILDDDGMADALPQVAQILLADLRAEGSSLLNSEHYFENNLPIFCA